MDWPSYIPFHFLNRETLFMNPLPLQALIADAMGTLRTMESLTGLLNVEIDHLVQMAGLDCQHQAEILADAVAALTHFTHNQLYGVGDLAAQIAAARTENTE